MPAPMGSTPLVDDLGDDWLLFFFVMVLRLGLSCDDFWFWTGGGALESSESKYTTIVYFLKVDLGQFKSTYPSSTIST
jgi:hypothetical protein